MKRFLWLIPVLILVLTVACAGPAAAPTATPAPQPQPTSAPSPGQTIIPKTSAPSPTAVSSTKTIEIKGVLSKMPYTYEGKMLLAAIPEIEKRSGGTLKFRVLGGDEVIPKQEQQEAVRKGVVDFCAGPANYAAGFVPESNVHTLLRMNNKEERDRGVWKFLNEIYQKQNLYYVTNLDPTNWEQNFMMYLNKPIQKPEDLKGMRLRSIASYQPLHDAFGAVSLSMAVTEMYTAIERGLINGGPNTVISFFDYALFEVIKYYVLPGFGHSQVVFYMNLDKWKSLSGDQQKLITDTLISLEPEYAKQFAADYDGQLAKVDKTGVKRIQLSPEDGERLVKTYYDGNWKFILKAAPANGAKLRQLAGLPPL